MTTSGRVLLACTLGAFVLGGCAGVGQKELGGGVLGAGAGTLLGAAVGGGDGKSMALGALIGGWAGSALGRQMDEEDKRLAAEAAARALEHSRSNQEVVWRNPDSGHSGTITPIRTYQHRGAYCREFRQVVNIGGRRQVAYGQACREPDGQWKIVQ